jgi:putative FmdB family regulatory protein
MPIYAYKCDACGHAQDILRKISDPALTECPACAAAFSKQVTAAGFQLKGSGWYVTDFRGGDKKPAAGDTAAATGAGTSAKSDAAPVGTPAAAPSAPAASSPSAAPATATNSVAASATNTGTSS